MANREFLQLAHVFDAKKHSIGGWFLSEKLDGMRAFWDGGITRGLPCHSIPFANVEKHARFKDQQYSTGLWSRYGQPIYAPDWWLDTLPKVFLDGELYAGRGKFQFVVSTVKDHVPGKGWTQIEYKVFDSPCPMMWLINGKINNTNFKKEFNNYYKWLMALPKFPQVKNYGGSSFESAYQCLSQLPNTEETAWSIHVQDQLPLSQDKALVVVDHWLNSITDAGGEGVILKKRESRWSPFRTNDLLKVKRFQDSEGVIIGYKTGRLTDKGSKLLGLMGAAIVSWNNSRGNNVKFELSGFTDEERILGYEGHNDYNTQGAREWAENNPESVLPEDMCAIKFPRGTKITFRYREETDDGMPKEARYWRKA